MEKILVIGSTSNVGRALIEELSGSGETVLAATRSPESFRALHAVEPVSFDYDEPRSFGPALEGTNRIFVLGPPVAEAHEAMLAFIQRATSSRKRKIVLMTAMGTDHEPEGYLRQVELAVERSGAPYVILRPNWFMDNFHTSWLAPIRDGGVIPLPAGDSRTSLIDARDIAACAAAALRTDRFDGRAFTLTGPQPLTYAEAAETLSRAAGKQVRYVPLDDESFVRSMVDAGAPSDLARYLAVLFSFARQGATEPVSTAVEEITGRQPRTLEQYAGDRASAWRDKRASAA